jgi:ferredoxin
MADTQECQIGRLTITIDRTVCIGSGNCVKLGREVFELDAEGIVTFRPGVGEGGDGGDEGVIDPDRLAEACRVCPVDALAAVDETGRRLAP